MLIFSNPWAAGFPANAFSGKSGGRKARGLQGRTTSTFTLRTCRAGLGWGCCSWEARLVLGGLLIPLPLHLQMHKHQRKEGDSGLAKGKDYC